MSALMSWVPAQMRSQCHLQFPTHKGFSLSFLQKHEAYGEVRVSPSQPQGLPGPLTQKR